MIYPPIPGRHATTAFLFPGKPPYPSPEAVVAGLTECQIPQVYLHKRMWHPTAQGRAEDDWLKELVNRCEAINISVGSHVGRLDGEEMGPMWLRTIRERIMALRIGGLVYADDAEEFKVSPTSTDQVNHEYYVSTLIRDLHPHGPNKRPFIVECSANPQVRHLLTGVGSGDFGSSWEKCEKNALAFRESNRASDRVTFGWWGEDIAGDDAEIVPLRWQDYSNAFGATFGHRMSMTYRTTLQAMTDQSDAWRQVRQFIGGCEQARRVMV